jgi:hypothetical protein
MDKWAIGEAVKWENRGLGPEEDCRSKQGEEEARAREEEGGTRGKANICAAR